MIGARVLAAAILLEAAAAAQQAPPRDAPRSTPVGRGSISGVVEVDDLQHKTLRRAKVMLNSPDLPLGRTIVTNDDGTFAFDRLPAGRYTIGVAKDGYVPLAYGAKRVARPGTPIPLAEGESKRIALRLPRGAVITGTVVDADGLPMPGVAVNAASYQWFTTDATGSVRRLRPAGVATTDDRGIYRLFGLPAGEYLVSTQVRQPAPGTGGSVFVPPGAPVDIVSEAEIRSALAGTPRNSAGRSSALSAGESPRRTVSFAPIYFPGGATEARATTVSIGPGEERSGIDLQLQYVPTTTIRVTLATTEPGRPAVGLSVAGPPYSGGLHRFAQADAEGRYVFNAVPPGSYTVMAFVMPAGPDGRLMLASSDIAVNGEEAVDTVLTPQPPLSISGRLVFDGARVVLPMPPGLTLDIPATYTSFTPELMSVPSPTLRFDAGGRFTIPDVAPGSYRFAAKSPGVRSAIGGWWLQSIAIGGRNILDGPFDLRQSTDDAVITLTDRATELSGRVTSSGRPVAECTVVIFAADPAAWFVNSRRVAGIRTGPDGRYAIANLPPGDYLVTASDDVDPGEWNDSSLLQRLAPGALRVRLAGFEKKTQDLVVDRQ